jgi:hypothetical protein
MTYAEAFARAVDANAETRRTVYIIKYLIDECYTPSWSQSYPNAVLIGEVRRMTPR